MNTISDPAMACPVPLRSHERILMAHGGGGRLMRDLIESVFIPAFGNAPLAERHDGAVLALAAGGGLGSKVAFTTDSYVVRPLFFPGGDIGTLAVNGTVNDLAMCGARPVCLSTAFILEEGFPMADLVRVATSMGQAADAVGVSLVTGDTKVVDKGKGDGIFINTAGLGICERARPIGPAEVRPGDLVLLSGDIGRHGIAILTAREGLGFETTLESDCAPLSAPVLALLAADVEVHCLRDLTRGGLGAALVEIAESGGVGIRIDEPAIAVAEPVQAACEVLGLDPLYVANEGRFVAFVAPKDAARALDILKRHRVSVDAACIGSVAAEPRGGVTMKTRLGAFRAVDLPSGEQLPRIC